MSHIKKNVGDIAIFISSDPENWISRARAFKEVAELVAKSDQCSSPIPYYYNAGLSLELFLKAIAITQAKKFEANHRLNDLCRLVGMQLSNDQKATIELLSEMIVWSGRYPIPKKTRQWDNYNVILEKHIIEEQEGNVSRIIANKARFPTLQNYLTLWEMCESLYESSKCSRP